MRQGSLALAAVATLALGGTAVAAKLITGAEIKNHSITGKDIRARSVPLKALKGQLPGGAAGPQGVRGDTGEPGPAGEPGQRGATGPSGATQYAHTKIVKSDGTAVQNGAQLISAMTSIADASAATPYLVKLEPGSYDVGSGFVDKSFVDIQGSGRDLTTITATDGLVVQANSYLRDLAINATTSGVFLVGVDLIGPASGIQDAVVTANASSVSIAIAPDGSGAVEVRHVDLSSSSSGVLAFAVRPTTNVDVTISDSSLRAIGSATSGAGLQQQQDGSIEVRDSSVEVTAIGGTGLEQDGAGTITITNSSLQAPTFGLVTSSGTVHVANSLVSSAQTPSGTMTCINSYKADFTTPTAGNCT